jgi:hypothetical protein
MVLETRAATGLVGVGQLHVGADPLLDGRKAGDVDRRLERAVQTQRPQHSHALGVQELTAKGAARLGGGLENPHLQPERGQAGCGGESREPATDHDDV